MPRKYAKQTKRRYRGRPRVVNRKYPAHVKVQQTTNPAQSIIAKTQGMYQDYMGMYNKYYPTAVEAYKLGAKALEMLNAEKKYFDITETSATVGSPGGTYLITSLLSSITQGDGPTNRDGSQIRLKSLNTQVVLTFNSSSTQSAQVVRWVLFRDSRVQVGGTPSYSDLYDSNNIGNTFLNIEDQFKRFRIIRSGLVTLSSAEPVTQVDAYIPCSLPVRYNTSNQVISNNVWLMIASTDGTNPPACNYRYRVRFYDN